jgi:protein required for attachment to host cells
MKLSGLLADKGLHAFDTWAHTHNGHAVPRVWIIVADKALARIWGKGAGHFEEIATAEYRAPAHHHGQHEQHEEDFFVEQLSEFLAMARDQEVFDRIVLVASKRMLGAFREKLPTDIVACVAAEIPKDLTHMGKKELENALHKIVVI